MTAAVDIDALAQTWAAAIAAASARTPGVAPRDGRRLRRLGADDGAALQGEGVAKAVAAALNTCPPLLAAAATGLSSTSADGQRCIAAAGRAAALLTANRPAAALADARAATAFAPSAPWAAAAAALRGAALSRLGDSSTALLSWCQACDAAPACGFCAAERTKAAAAAPPRHAAAAAKGGAAALAAIRARDVEAAKPEVLRQRPPYYYYYRWMTKRIQAIAATTTTSLPPAVLRRLLTADAGALDDLLSHAPAAARAVAALTEAHAEGGVAAIEAMPLPCLSWAEMKELTAARAAGEKGVAIEAAGDRGVAIEAAAREEAKALPAGGAVKVGGWDEMDEWVDG